MYNIDSMLKAYALTTPERLSAFIGQDPPDVGTPQYTAMEALINSVTEFIESYCNRRFKQTAYIEEYSTERGQTINLKNYPVLESEPFLLEKRASQLSENHWEVIDGLYYTVDMDAGIVECMDGVYFFKSRNGYRITYTSGYDFDVANNKFLADTQAGDIEVVAWLISQDVWKNRGMPSNMYQERIGDYSITLQRLAKGTTGMMFDNPQIATILDGYVREVTVGVLTPLQSI